MSTSPAIVASRNFIVLVTEGPTPTVADLTCALDQLAIAYHETPEAFPAQSDLDPPEPEGQALYQSLGERFPDFGSYGVADPQCVTEDPCGLGDAIDDLRDIVRDLTAVCWRFDNLGLEDAHWCFRLSYCHWGRHLRELSLYLHSKQFG